MILSITLLVIWLYGYIVFIVMKFLLSMTQNVFLKNTDKLPWIEKYRPKLLSDMIDHKEKIDTIKHLITNHELPHLLFYGPPGSGKTSMILAIAREMYGETNYRNYILEINASGDRGIDTVRTNVMNFVKSRSDQVKLVILDEADAMTTDAQRALHNIIEKSSKYARFCLICNNINKILEAVKSRCVKMRFGAVNPEQMRVKLKEIIIKENIHITDEAIQTLITIEKDFRQVLNILQGLYFLHQDDTDLSTIIDKIRAYELPCPCKRIYIYHYIDPNGQFEISKTLPAFNCKLVPYCLFESISNIEFTSEIVKKAVAFIQAIPEIGNTVSKIDSVDIHTMLNNTDTIYNQPPSHSSTGGYIMCQCKYFPEISGYHYFDKSEVKWSHTKPPIDFVLTNCLQPNIPIIKNTSITDDTITSDSIYRYLGKPDSECMNKIIKTLFNNTFDEGNKMLLDMYRSNLWNTEDLLEALRNKVLTININFDSKSFLIAKIAEIEFRIKMGSNSESQLIYLASCFQLARQMSAKSSK